MDVLQDRLVDRLRTFSSEGDTYANLLLTLLSRERSAARIHMLDALGSVRYRRWPAPWRRLAPIPAFSAEAELAIEERAVRVLPHLVNKSWKKLRVAVRNTTPKSTDVDLHALSERIRVPSKRVRCGACEICGEAPVGDRELRLLGDLGEEIG